MAPDPSNPMFFILGFLAGLVFTYYHSRITEQKKPVRKPRKTSVSKSGAAKNAAVLNSTVEYQKIKTAEIEIPVIASDVLTYGPGELGEAWPDVTRLYYPPEPLKDPEYLETVRRSPLQVMTHEKNTGEGNRGVDGWPVSAFWDETEKRVKLKGILHGEENVKYAEANKNKPGFGTSAFISFLKIDRESGTSPEGKPYDAIVRKAVNNHVAILPNIRDPKNVILAMNAVRETEDEEKIFQNDTHGLTVKEQENKKMPIDPTEFKSAMQAYMSEKEEEDGLVNKIKNAVLEGLKNEKPEEKPEEKPKAENEKPEEKEEKKEEASNARPSDAMVKDFSDALGVSFNKAPSLKELAAIAGVTGDSDAELVTALNAKRETLKKPVEQAASNSRPIPEMPGKSVDDFLKEI